MSEILLFKFEKEKRVIELYLQDKTIREIAKEVHMSFRDISNIIKRYNRKIRAQQNNKEDGQTKKLSLSTQAFKLFHEGKKPIDVKCELDIPYEKIRKFWSQFLKLTRMEECYDLYTEYSQEIPTLLSISNFIKRNNVSGKDIPNVLRTANDVNNLNQYYSNLKAEIEKSEQQIRKNNYIDSQNTNYQLPPMQPLPRYPSSWNGYYY